MSRIVMLIALSVAGVFTHETAAQSSELQYEIKSVWKSQKAVPGKQYLASVSVDGFSDGSYAVLFGEKNGELQFRRFRTNGLLEWAFEGAWKPRTAKDDDYSFVAEAAEKEEKNKDLLRVVLRNPEGKMAYKMLFDRRDPDSGSAKFAEAAVGLAFADYEKILSDKTPDTLAAFKELINFTLERYGYSPGDGYGDPKFPLAVFHQQIEFQLDITPPSKKIATARILKNGKDPISKMLREANAWTDYDDLPQDEDWANYPDPDKDYQSQVFSFYRPVAEYFQSKQLLKAAKKFVRYEVVNVRGDVCEDSYYITPDIFWVLIDGSVVNYSVGTECD